MMTRKEGKRGHAESRKGCVEKVRKRKKTTIMKGTIR